MQERFSQIRRDQEASLLDRRRELANLYNSEMDNWTDEIMSKTETLEDQKQRQHNVI